MRSYTLLRCTARALLVLVVLVAGAACTASGVANAPSHNQAGASLARDARWTVLPVEGAPDAGVARSLEVLIESALRGRGVRRVSTSVDGHAGDGDYALSARVLSWRESTVPGERGDVAIALSILDAASGRDLFVRSDAETVSMRRAPVASAQRLVERLLDVPTLVAGDAASLRADVAPRSRPAPVAGVVDVARLPVAERASMPSYRVARSDTSLTRLSRAEAARFDGRSTAFWYAQDPPLALLGQFDRVVLEPDNVRAGELAALERAGASSFAYLSIGEVGATRDWGRRLAADWTLGRNEAWNSRVMDLAHPGWAEFVLERTDELVAAGYDGLFLDTMDSFLIEARTPAEIARQSAALASLVRRIAERHPELRLVANRGFEVMDAIGDTLEAVAAESLYARWDAALARYVPVPEADREWLLGKLQAARAAHGVDLIGIDYLPPSQRDAARAVASRIAADDIVPWVATPAFDHVGVGALDVLPREVLMLFDSRVNGRQEDAEVHRLLATPLEYFGYVPVYHDVAEDGPPPASLGGRYAGITVWARGAQFGEDTEAWLADQLRAGVRVALFGTRWLTPGSDLAALMGVEVGAPLLADRARVSSSDALVGFERPLPPRLEPMGALAVSTRADNDVHLSLGDPAGARADLVISGAWGGLAQDPGVLDLDLDGVAYWILDPYAFLERALDLARAPMPDVTSERGKRLWLAHIDGDALPSWAELPGRRLGAEVIAERILDRWPWPHTISIVEAEIMRVPAYSDRRARMIRVARELFARPEVEIASHTFSHPYQWAEVARAPTSGRFNLPVGNYRYDAEREVAGSAAFIDRRLAPPGKRTEVMLWSGDALPGADALAAAEAAGLANMNGGVTTITRATPALSLVTPMARTVGEHVQVYAPIMNENVYTNNWQGPFDGFRRVIETFELTERPRRLKPINIYYHFYAGTKPASIRSLEEVYAWSTAQDVHPVTVGDYSRRVQIYRQAGVARTLDGRWRISGLDGLRSLRVIGADLNVDRSASDGVASVHPRRDALYLHVSDGDHVTLSIESLPALGAAEAERAR